MSRVIRGKEIDVTIKLNDRPLPRLPTLEELMADRRVYSSKRRGRWASIVWHAMKLRQIKAWENALTGVSK